MAFLIFSRVFSGPRGLLAWINPQRTIRDICTSLDRKLHKYTAESPPTALLRKNSIQLKEEGSHSGRKETRRFRHLPAVGGTSLRVHPGCNTPSWSVLRHGCRPK